MLPFNLNRKRPRFPFEETLASGRYRSRFRNREGLTTWGQACNLRFSISGQLTRQGYRRIANRRPDPNCRITPIVASIILNTFTTTFTVVAIEYRPFGPQTGFCL